MPLQLASDTILRMFRARIHHHRQGQIMHNLSHAIDVDTRLARMEERSRHVQINDDSLCDSCHARLGTKLFAMYPDDTVVCYKVITILCISLYFFHVVFVCFSWVFLLVCQLTERFTTKCDQ
ncbi:vacuolar sorting protein 3-like isoform X1 [Tripterygium wilfordii]|uniref:vacuolar sorting protein 3-like isoform X1 n=1 Tax=Tripterygium wilfordii TaxID=458696 RepID=UPI0018F835C2|nr:vacuolar sorting protein 3-like isoform X1 [Tripterygium wilfordii]